MPPRERVFRCSYSTKTDSCAHAGWRRRRRRRRWGPSPPSPLGQGVLEFMGWGYGIFDDNNVACDGPPPRRHWS